MLRAQPTSSDTARHGIAVCAYLLGYPLVTIVLVRLGPFDFLYPVVELYVLFESYPMAEVCRTSPGCTVASIAYFALPLEIVRRTMRLLFRGPALGKPELRAALDRPIVSMQFALCLCVVLLIQAAVTFRHVHMDVPAFSIPAWLGVLAAACFATRHLARAWAPHERDEGG